MTQVTNMARRIVELEDGLRSAVKLSAEQADEAVKWRARAQAAEAVVQAARNDPIKSRSVKRALTAYDKS